MESACLRFHLPLPLWERRRPPSAAVLGKKDAEAKLGLRRIDRCDPGEGLSSHDGAEPLTPPLSHKGRGSAPPLSLQINLISSRFRESSRLKSGRDSASASHG